MYENGARPQNLAPSHLFCCKGPTENIKRRSYCLRRKTPYANLKEAAMGRELMNQILVAELLAEDALLKEIADELAAAMAAGNTEQIQAAETMQLKHNNLRRLILSEMSKLELELYEMQRDHGIAALLESE